MRMDIARRAIAEDVDWPGRLLGESPGSGDAAAWICARQEPIAAPTRSEPGALAAIGQLLGMTGAEIDRARGLLTLLGDPARRTVLERLSRQPDRPGRTLPDVTGLAPADLYHRLRSLTHCGAITKNRHHIYSVDPGALVCASRYADTLVLAASLTARDPPR